MSEATIQEQFEWYLDALNWCTSDLLRRSDEDIEYSLFEQFDCGAISFLHESTLLRLQNAGFIDNRMVEASKEIRRAWLGLSQDRPTIPEIRTSREWSDLFRKCDALRVDVARHESVRIRPSESSG